MLKRFLTGNPVIYRQAIEAASSYVSKLQEGDVGWLHSKPFDPTPGNPQYFRLMYDLLNLLQAMQIPAKGRVLEIGVGPGWITEILLMLGFTIDALEPSLDLIKIAKLRCESLAPHYHHPSPSRVCFHQATLEEIEFPEQSFDAILFFDVLHHIVDETTSIKKIFDFLKPGGRLGVVEGAWHPEFIAMEQMCVAEMEKFGTLENPFSTEYLDQLLDGAGFIEIERYVGVNGFFLAHQLRQTLLSFGTQAMCSSNNVTAKKPDQNDVDNPNCVNLKFVTNASIDLISGAIEILTGTAALVISVKNSGETFFDNDARKLGHVTLALRRGAPESAQFTECKERHVLTKALLPGDELEMNIRFTLPSGVPHDDWELDLIAEGAYWFSSRNIKTCPIPNNRAVQL